MPKFSTDHNSGKRFGFFLKLILSSTCHLLSFTVIAQIVFFNSLLTRFHYIFFSKGHNSRKGHNHDKKKNTGQLFYFIKNPYTKFQKPSTDGSKVMLYTQKRDRRTNRRTDKPKAICATNFFEVGGGNI